jgi:hypothetical protein
MMAQNTHWKISPATEADKTHPIKLRTEPHIWFIREEIG